MGETVDLREVARRGIRPIVDVQASAVFLAVDAVDALGAPEEDPLGASVAATLDAPHRAALAPMVASRVFPEAIFAWEHRALPPRDRLRLVAASDPAEMLADLGPWLEEPAWAPVLRAPDRWLAVVADATARVWPIARSLLTVERLALQRLVARVRAAREPDAIARLVEQLHVRSHVRDGLWQLRPDGPEMRIPEDGLELLPVLTTPDRSLTACDHRTHVVSSLLGGVSTRARDHWALEALLGPVRARVLRLLDVPQTMTALGETLEVVPSVATHHVSALERMGLVDRSRRGRFVAVVRTERGDELLRAYRIAPLSGRGTPLRDLAAQAA